MRRPFPYAPRPFLEPRPLTNDTNPFYDAIATYYPYFYRDWETQLQREGLGLRAIFRGRDVRRVLDASCGAGAQAIPLAQLGYQVVAADPSAGMLRKAHEFAARYGQADAIQFERADFLSLPGLVDGPFDAVISKGTALPHLLTDAEIVRAVQVFHDLLRPGGTLVLGMRDFGPFMEHRPRFLPGFVHDDMDAEQGEVITFDIWEWHDGPPVIATQNLFIVHGYGRQYDAQKRTVVYRPLSVTEVQVVLEEVGFVHVENRVERTDTIIIATRPA